MIWNPFAVTPLGQPVGPVGPPALRVLGGQASAAQLAMAQAAFARFCTVARTSAGPNATAQGRLPDGTPYRISVVGRSAVMEIWPAGTGTDSGRGVLVRAKDLLYLLSFRNGRWESKSIPSAYGGTAAWVSADGRRYFTDALLQLPGAEAMLNRKHLPQVSSGPQAQGATGISRGMAYGDANGGGSFIGPHGRYVQVAISAQKVLIAEAELVSDAQAAATPQEVVRHPAPVAELPVSLPVGLQLAQLNGVARESRWRSGEGMSRGLVGSAEVGLDELPAMPQGQWITSKALTDELVVRVNRQGIYSLETRAVGSPQYSILTPAGADFPPKNPMWRMTFEEYRNPTDQGIFYLPMQDLNGGSIAVPGARRDIVASGRRNTYEYEFHRSAPVCLGYGWDDSRKVFMLRSEDSHRIVSEYGSKGIGAMPLAGHNGAFWYRFLNASYDTSPISGDPPGQWNVYYDWGVAGDMAEVDAQMQAYLNPANPIIENGKRTRTGRYVCRKVLETPWGETALLDVDVVATLVREDAIYGKNSEIISPVKNYISAVNGVVLRRKLIHLDPVLEVMAYFEAITDEFEITGSDASTVVRSVNSRAAMVLLRAGAELYRHPVEGIDEAEVTGIDWLGVSDPRLGDAEQIWTEHTVDSVVVANKSIPEYEVRQIPAVLKYQVSSLKPQLFEGVAQATVQLANYPVPIPTIQTLPEFAVRSAIDPGSGAAVLALLQEGQVVQAWALPPEAGAQPIAGVLPVSAGQMTGFLASA